MAAHVIAQNLVDLGLVLLATRLEPGEHIGIETQADRLLDRAIEMAGSRECIDAYCWMAHHVRFVRYRRHR